MANKFDDPGSERYMNSLIGASPVAVGMGVGLRRLLKDRPVGIMDPIGLQGSVFRDVASDILAKSSRMPSVNTSFLPPPGIADETLRTAWELTKVRMDPLLRKNLKYTGRLDTMAPGGVVEAIRREITGNGSLSMRRAAIQFERHYRDILTQQTMDPMFSDPKFVGVEARKPRGALGYLHPELKPYMQRIQALGPVSTEFHRNGSMPGRGFQRINIAHGLGERGLEISLPIAPSIRDRTSGLMTEGKYGQVTRIAPTVGVVNAEGKLIREMTRHEFFMEELTRGILPRIKSGDLYGPSAQSAIDRLRLDVFGSQEVVNVSRSGKGRTYGGLRGQQVDIVLENLDRGERGRMYRPATETEFGTALRSNAGLYGGTSPTALAGSRATRVNISKLGITPSAMDWAARYDQGIKEWFLSDSSQRALANRSGTSHFAKLTTPEAAQLFGGESRLPRFRTLYADRSVHEAVFDTLDLGEGEAAAHRRIQRQMEWQTPTRKHIQMVDESVLGLIEKGDFEALKARIIGTETKTGKLFTLPETAEEIAAIVRKSPSLGHFLDVEYLDTVKPGEVEKFFGDIKALMRFTQAEEFDAAVKTLGFNPTLTGFDIIADMSMLKKNRLLHNEQMITSLYDIIMRGNERQALRRNAKLAAFMDDPVQVARKMMEEAVSPNRVTKAMEYDHNKMIGAIARLAAPVGLSPYEKQLVFGAVGTVLGRDRGPGVAGAVSRIAFEGPAYKDILGSVEPRAFLALQGGALGDLGESIAGDISLRLGTNTDALTTHTEVTRSLLSVLEGKRGTLGASDMVERFAGRPGDLGKAFSRFVEEGGGAVTLGKGLGEIYVPGADTISTMRAYRTAAGKDVYSSLYHTYEDIIRGASRMYGDVDQLTAREFEKQTLLPALQELSYHQAPAGKGLGGFQRGKTFGSRYLRGVSKFGDWQPGYGGLHTIGVSEVRGMDMLQEMKLSGLYSESAVEDMIVKFQAGEEIGGLMSRHPFIGQFSHQPVGIRMVQGGQADLVAIGEMEKQIRLASGETKSIKLGPLVGLAGDKDADIFSVMLLSPDVEKDARRAVESMDTDFMQSYMRHQVRYQLMKTKRAGYTSAVTLADAMEAGSRKLGTVQRYVPQLSMELTKARAAVGSYLTGQERGAAEAMLEWLEQSPISAKHFTEEGIRENKLAESLNQIVFGLQQHDPKYGTQQIRMAMGEMLDNSSSVQEAMGKMIELDKQTAKGLGIDPRLAGFDVERTLENIVSARSRFEGTKQARILEQMTGRAGKMTRKEMLLMARANVAGKPTGVMAAARSAMAASDNMINAAGRGIKHMAAPLGIGFAAAIGLSAALSSPEQTIGPGRALNPAKASLKYNSKAANRMKPSDLHPAQPTMGQPRAPNMLRQRDVRLSGPGPSPSVHVKARGNYLMNTQSIGDMIRSSTGSSTSINISDRRSLVDIHAAGNRGL